LNYCHSDEGSGVDMKSSRQVYKVKNEFTRGLETHPLQVYDMQLDKMSNTNHLLSLWNMKSFKSPMRTKQYHKQYFVKPCASACKILLLNHLLNFFVAVLKST
jgi:hypothetical protein